MAFLIKLLLEPICFAWRSLQKYASNVQNRDTGNSKISKRYVLRRRFDCTTESIERWQVDSLSEGHYRSWEPQTFDYVRKKTGMRRTGQMEHVRQKIAKAIRIEGISNQNR